MEVTVYALDAVPMPMPSPLAEQVEERRRQFLSRCRDRGRYSASLCAGLLLRQIFPGCRERFRYGAEGRPELPGEPGFSLSYAGRRLYLAVGGRPGLDAVEVGSWDHRLTSRILAGPELDWWRGVPAEERDAAAALLWACKESFLKYTGHGLSRPPAQVRVPAQVLAGGAAPGQGAWLCALAPEEGIRAALCCGVPPDSVRLVPMLPVVKQGTMEFVPQGGRTLYEASIPAAESGAV